MGPGERRRSPDGATAAREPTGPPGGAPAPPGPAGDEKAGLAALRAEFEARGWSRPPTGRLLLELSVHVALTLGALAVFVAAAHPLVRVVAIGVSTLGLLGLATNTHTSSHYATSRRPWVNRLLTYFGYSFFLGLSATYWWHKHVVVHHPAPNVVGVDADADLSPWFLLTQPERERVRGLGRLYYRYQWLIFPFAIALNGVNMSLTGWRFVVGRLRDRERRTTAHWIDLGALGLHVACWIVLPMLVFAPAGVLALYGLRIVLLGYAMFIVFAPGHFPAEAASLEARPAGTDFVLLQTASSLNFRTGAIGRFFCGGLEHQIEHHLFPNIAHVHFRKMAPLVEEFCRRHGYPYRTLGWARALRESLAVLRVPKRVAASPAALRPGRLATAEEASA